MRMETDKRGAVWSVRDLAPGVTEHTLIRGAPAAEFRVGGNCGLADRSRSARTRYTQSRVASPSSRRTKRVVLTAQARQMIIEELCGWEDGPHEARETAGFLAGRVDGSTILITGAWGPGPDAVRSYDRVTLDMGYMDSIRNALLPGERIIGDFHSHPRRASSSTTDEQSWATLAKRNTGKWLGLIATRAGADWAYPEFTAYLSRGQNRADPIELEVQRWRQ